MKQFALTIFLITLTFLAACKEKGETYSEDASTSAPSVKSGMVELPDNYAEEFHNYLSLDRIQNHDQTIRLFANDIAMQGPGLDGKLPFGSVIVAEIYKALKDKNGEVIQSSLGRRIRGEMALIAVMQRQQSFTPSADESLANEHWEFGAFKPDGSVAPKELNDCRRCHAPLDDTHHLFSYEHLGGFAK